MIYTRCPTDLGTTIRYSRNVMQYRGSNGLSGAMGRDG